MMQKEVDRLRARAEAAFEVRHQKKQDTPIAMREYREAEQAERDKMLRLREERLARIKLWE
jgi:hypothetical protein